MTTARELMTESPTAIDATATLRTAIDRMATLDIRHLPVVDTNGALIGMLSDRDLRGQTQLDDAVASIMSAPPICVQADADSSCAIDAMLYYKIGAVPVVDGEKTLLGIVSYVDVLRMMRT